MSDFLGPASAPYAVTDRPADTRTFGTVDTFFRDCTSVDIEDGTDIEAAWLNGVTVALRNLWRMNGSRADGSAVVLENGNDDYGLVKAVQQVLQRGQVVFGVDTGVANALVVSLVPALIEYKAGLRLYVKIAATNVGGAVTINVNGLGVKSVSRRDGLAPLDADLTVGSVVELIYDGAKFQIPSAFGPGQLIRNLTLYVNAATGDDSNDGSTAAKAFKTAQRAIDIVWSYGPGPYTVTINLADGTYGKVGTLYRAGPSVVLNGNSVTPSNVIIDGGNDHCVRVSGPNTLRAQNLRVQNSAGPSNGGFVAVNGATLTTSNTVSGNITGAVFEAFAASISPGNHVFAGNSAEWFWAEQAGSMQITGGLVFNASTPLAVVRTVLAQDGGSVAFASPAATFVNPGNVSGAKYLAAMCGTIQTLGSGESYLPGTTAGGRVTGGQYA